MWQDFRNWVWSISLIHMRKLVVLEHLIERSRKKAQFSVLAWSYIVIEFVGSTHGAKLWSTLECLGLIKAETPTWIWVQWQECLFLAQDYMNTIAHKESTPMNKDIPRKQGIKHCFHSSIWKFWRLKGKELKDEKRICQKEIFKCAEKNRIRLLC